MSTDAVDNAADSSVESTPTVMRGKGFARMAKFCPGGDRSLPKPHHACNVLRETRAIEMRPPSAIGYMAKTNSLSIDKPITRHPAI
jgi:hypothetical protein